MASKQRGADYSEITLGDYVFDPSEAYGHAYGTEVVGMRDDWDEVTGEPTFTRWLANGTVLEGGRGAWIFIECDASHPDAV